jgi:hypothetical protein
MEDSCELLHIAIASKSLETEIMIFARNFLKKVMKHRNLEVSQRRELGYN